MRCRVQDACPAFLDQGDGTQSLSRSRWGRGRVHWNILDAAEAGWLRLLLNLTAIYMFGFTVGRGVQVSRRVGVSLTVSMVSSKSHRPCC
jgi:hypothetical protein